MTPKEAILTLAESDLPTWHYVYQTKNSKNGKLGGPAYFPNHLSRGTKPFRQPEGRQNQDRHLEPLHTTAFSHHDILDTRR